MISWRRKEEHQEWLFVAADTLQAPCYVFYERLNHTLSPAQGGNTFVEGAEASTDNTPTTIREVLTDEGFHRNDVLWDFGGPSTHHIDHEMKVVHDLGKRDMVIGLDILRPGTLQPTYENKGCLLDLPLVAMAFG